MTPRLSILMPFHNEEATLPEIITRVLSAPLPMERELVLIDDGSTDASLERVSPFLGDPRVKLLRSSERRGKGAAVNQGLGESTGTFIVIQDADLEYSPEDYARLLAPLLTGEHDFVLGSRVLSAQSWRIRKLAGQPLYTFTLNAGAEALTRMVRTLYRTRITDPATMMKVFRRSCLDDTELDGRGFDWDWELVCKVLRKGITPFEVPITYRARAPREGKKLRLWKDGWSAFYTIARYRFSAKSSAFAESGTRSESIT